MASAISLVKPIDKMFDPSDPVLDEDSNGIETEGQTLVCLIFPIILGHSLQFGAFSGRDRFEWMSGTIARARLHLASDERPPVPGNQIYLAERTTVILDNHLIAFRPQETRRLPFPSIPKAQASLSQAA